MVTVRIIYDNEIYQLFFKYKAITNILSIILLFIAVITKINLHFISISWKYL